MGIIIKKGIHTTLISYFGIILGTISLLWIQPSILTIEEIGILRLVQDLGFLIASLAQFSASGIIDRYYPQFHSEDNHQKGFFTLLLAYPLPFYFFSLLVFWVFREFWEGIYLKESPDFVPYFIWTLPFAFIMIYQIVIEAFARANFIILTQNFIREIGLRLSLILLLILSYFSILDFESLIPTFVAVYGLLIFILLIYVKQKANFKINFNYSFVNKYFLKDIFTFSSYSFMGGVSGLIIAKVDIIMLSALAGTAVTGIFTTTAFIGTVIEIPKRAVGQIAIPLISRAFQDNKPEEVEKIYKKSSINLMIIGCFLFLGIWCNVDFIFGIIPKGDIYEQGKYVVLFIALSKVIDMAFGLNTECIQISKHYKFNLYLNIILATLIVSTNLIFIPLYGVNGAAFATLASVLIVNICRYIFIKYKLKIQAFSHKNALCLGLVIFTYLLVNQIPHLGLWTTMLVKSASIVILISVGVYVLNLSEEYNQLIKKLALKIL